MLNYTKDEIVVDDVRTKTDALERLADELRARGFQTDLVTPVGKRAYLHVRNPQAGMLAENIVSEAGWYWYSWAERIASIHEVVRAAEKISRVLSATSGERDPAI